MKVTVRGIADVNEILGSIAPREAKNLMRATVFDIAKTVADDAAELAPSDKGELKAAIKAKRGRGTRNTVEAQAVVGKTAFYWRFLEFGQGPDKVEHAFFLRAARALEANLDRVYLETFGKKLTARLGRLARKSKG